MSRVKTILCLLRVFGLVSSIKEGNNRFRRGNFPKFSFMYFLDFEKTNNWGIILINVFFKPTFSFHSHC